MNQSDHQDPALIVPSEARERVTRLRRLDCCTVSDAFDRLKILGVISGIPQQSGASRIAGLIITVKLERGTAPAGAVRHLGTTAIEAGGPYHAIAVEQRPRVADRSAGGLAPRGAEGERIA